MTNPIEWIKGLLSKLEHLIIKLKPETEQALAMSTALRNFLKSPEADLVVSVIPVGWAPEAKAEAEKALDAVIPLLDAENTCGTDLQCWATKIKTWPVDLQDSIEFKFAAKLLGYYDQFKQAQHVYDTIIQNTVAGGK